MMGTNRPYTPRNANSNPRNQQFPVPNHQAFNNRFSSGTGPPIEISQSQQYYGNYLAPPPPPPRPPVPPQALKFATDADQESESLLPPGISHHEMPTNAHPPPYQRSDAPPLPLGITNNNEQRFEPLSLPPLPPLFPYLSPELAQSFQEGASQCGTSFSQESADLPFVPVIINDKDLKKMTEIVKTQVEESKQKNLLLYEDIINQGLPKELKEMFQPLYCKLCKLTLSSPVVARDHYKGKRHNKAAEVWVQNNAKKIVKERGFNSQAPLNGVITRQQLPPPRNQSVNNPPNNQGNIDKRNTPTNVRNQHGFDRRPLPPPLMGNNFNERKRTIHQPDGRFNQNQSVPEFIPAYRAALAVPSPARKKPKKDGGSGPNFGFCELCNVSLTSQATSDQHYNGKNHKQKLLLGRKTGQFGEDPRFGIGTSFLQNSCPSSNISGNQRFN